MKIDGDTIRMELADMGNATRMAKHIISSIDSICTPVPIEDIAYALGIKNIHREDTDGKFEGVLVADTAKDKGSIWINSASTVARQRFTLAHELGHFLLPNHDARAQCSNSDLSASTSLPKFEQEANEFAAQLLMPDTMFRKDMERLGAPELNHVIKLAEKYEVSKEAAAIRFTQLCDEPCAVIFSEKGKFRFAPRSKEFPFITLIRDRRLPIACPILQSDIQHEVVSEWFETSIDNWAADEQYYGQTMLTGQHYDYGRGFRMALLLFPDPIEN